MDKKRTDPEKRTALRLAKLNALLGAGAVLATSIIVCAASGPKLPPANGE
jgi:hypothetical protein